jgi:Zn-dependent protease/CBS domain-containing protein
MADGQRRGFRLARVGGVEVTVDWSLAVMFVLIATNLGAGLLPLRHPDWPPALRWGVAVVAAMLFFGSVLAHELAHALVARRHGVPVEGITLFVFGGVSRIGAEPPTPMAELLIAGVGPLTSLAIGIVATLLGGWLAGVQRSGERPGALLAHAGPIATLLLWLGPINVLLALFNMLPGFPLDGGRVLRALLWRASGDLERATRRASAVGRGIALALVFLGIWMAFGHRVPFLGAGLVSGLWLVFIGWFLHNAAVASQQQVIARQLLRGLPVARLMRPYTPSLSPLLPVSALADLFLGAGDQRCFTVADGDRLVGLVCLSDLRKVPRAAWAERTVGEIMTPAQDLASVRPGEEVADALRKLTSRDVDQLPVVEDGHLRGMLRRADVLRWLELGRA